MTDLERLSTIQSYAWTLELLGEALVQHDEMLECEHNPHLSFRNTAGIHQAIRIISRLASEQCGKTNLLQGIDGDDSGQAGAIALESYGAAKDHGRVASRPAPRLGGCSKPLKKGKLTWLRHAGTTGLTE